MRVARLMEAADTRDEARAAPRPGLLEVAWIGRRPAWLDEEHASTALDGFAITSTITTTTRVVHLASHASESVADVRAAQPDAAVVVDIGQVASAPGHSLAGAEAADVVLVESEADARRMRAHSTALDSKVTIAPSPLDLEWHAPEATLLQTAGLQIKRFRRLHRLAHPTILFVGPYTPSGGLDLLIAATYRLRGELEDLRLAAVPLGAVEQKYLDRCEMEALALGHRGIVEWTRSPDTLRLWYATATLVCCPWREPCESPEAPTLAAAAGRPFVGTALPVFRESFRAPEAPVLVEPGDLDALVEALEPLLADVARATELGGAARSAAEGMFSFDAAARRLGSLWNAVAERPRRTEAA